MNIKFTKEKNYTPCSVCSRKAYPHPRCDHERTNDGFNFVAETKELIYAENSQNEQNFEKFKMIATEKINNYEYNSNQM